MSIFDTIRLPRIKATTQPLSFDWKGSTSMGNITPILIKETYPGDIWRHKHELFVQFAPMNSLLMQQFDVRVEYYHVPARLVYADFEKFLVGGVDGKTAYIPPYVTLGDLLDNGLVANGSLVDYMGLPTTGLSASAPADVRAEPIDIMPFRAYQKIYNDYYRDENLIPEIPIDKSGGYQSTFPSELFEIRKRAWRKDYFTSALPWAQKGDQVVLPLGDKAPIVSEYADYQQSMPAAGNEVVPLGDYDSQTGLYNYNRVQDRQDTTQVSDAETYADLSNATSATIDELRTAEAVQLWLEKNARGGTRYNEQVYSHFGVRTPDARLDRPELIQRVMQPVTFGNIYATNGNDGDNIQGYPVANAASGGRSKRFRYYVREHGYIIGVLTVIPKASYFQGLPKMYSRMDKFDYYWPDFAHLGEEPIKNKELYLADNSININGDFGYIPRYASLKTSLDEIHGDYRGNLNYYHDARIFTTQPTLSQQFIEIDESRDRLTRIFNVLDPEVNKLYIDIFHHLKAVRKMPYFGIPMFRTH